MEEDHVVYTFQKNPEEEVRLSVRLYKGRQYFDLRLWFQPSSGGEYHPTKKGLTLALEHLPELKKGLERVGRLASELALQKPSNSVESHKLEKARTPNHA